MTGPNSQHLKLFKRVNASYERRRLAWRDELLHHRQPPSSSSSSTSRSSPSVIVIVSLHFSRDRLVSRFIAATNRASPRSKSWTNLTRLRGDGVQSSESSVERNSNESRRLIAPDDRPPITQHQRFFRSPLEDNNTGWNEKRRRGHAREIGASGSRGDTSAPFFPILSPPRFPFLSFLRSSLSPDSLWPAPLSRRCAGRSSRRRLAVDPSPRPCLRPWPPRRASPLLPS